MSTGYSSAWEAKGVAWQSRPWAAISGKTGRHVLSVWNNVDMGHSEVRYIDGRDVMRCPPGDWVTKPKGATYLKACKLLLASGELAEVVMVRGARGDGSKSTVHRAWIDPVLQFVRITRADDDGTVEGVFHERA